MERLFAIVLIAFCGPLWAQDESYLREKMLPLPKEKPPPERYLVRVSSPVYRIDLNGDNRDEGIRLSKRDHRDWLIIEDYHGRKIFEHQVVPQGPGSGFLKIQIRRLSKHSKVLILHYNEGATNYLEFRSTGRFYFLTIDNDNLKSLSILRGPRFWFEVKNKRKQYFNRHHKISVIDLDGDGIRDISVRYHTITELFLYKGAGAWGTFATSQRKAKI